MVVRTSNSRSLLVAIALASAGGAAIFPALPALQAEHGLSTSVLGLMVGAGFLATVVGEIVLAPYADRGWERHLLVAGLAGIALGMGWTAVATQVWEFVAARAVIGGAMGALLPAASGLVIRARPEASGEQIGRLYAADLAGFAVGPLVAALVLAALGVDATLVAGASIVLGAALAVTWMSTGGRSLARLAHTGHARIAAAPGAQPAHGTDEARPREPRVAFDLLRHPVMWGGLLLTFTITIPVGAYDALWPRLVADLGGSDLVVGLSYTAFAIPFALVAGWAGRLADRVGPLRAARRGLALMLPAVLAYGLVANLAVIVGFGIVESTGQALASTAAAAAVAYAAPARRAAAAQGLARAGGTLVAAGTSVIAAPVYQELGRGVLFVGTAAVVLVVLVAATRLLRGLDRGVSAAAPTGSASAEPATDTAVTAPTATAPVTAVPVAVAVTATQADADRPGAGSVRAALAVGD